MIRRATSGRARAAGRVRGRTNPLLERGKGCGYGQGSPRAAEAGARAQGEKRTVGAEGVRDLVDERLTSTKAALVVTTSKGYCAISSRMSIERGRHHL